MSPRRGGYIRASASDWEPEHYAATWTPDRPASLGWASVDVAWQEDRGELMSVRKLAEFLGWTRRAADALLFNCARDRARWAKLPEPVRVPKVCQKRDRGSDPSVPEVCQPDTDERHESDDKRDSSVPDPGQKCATSETLTRVIPYQPQPQLQPQLQDPEFSPDARETDPNPEHPCPTSAERPAQSAANTSTSTTTPSEERASEAMLSPTGQSVRKPGAPSPPDPPEATTGKGEPMRPTRLTPGPIPRAAQIAQVRHKLATAERTLTAMRSAGVEPGPVPLARAAEFRAQLETLEALPDEPSPESLDTAPPTGRLRGHVPDLYGPPRRNPDPPGETDRGPVAPELRRDPSPRPVPVPELHHPAPPSPVEPDGRGDDRPVGDRAGIDPEGAPGPETTPSPSAVLIVAPRANQAPQRREESILPPVPAGWIRVPATAGGVCDVPAGLDALLSGLGGVLAPWAGWLVEEGISTSAALLELTAQEVQMIPRFGSHRARRIALHLRENHGVTLGCLAPLTPDPKSRVSAMVAADRIFNQLKRGQDAD